MGLFSNNQSSSQKSQNNNLNKPYIFKVDTHLQQHESLDSKNDAVNKLLQKQEMKSKKIEDKFEFIDWKKNEEQVKLNLEEERRRKNHLKLVQDVVAYREKKEMFIRCQKSADILMKAFYDNKTRSQFREQFTKKTFLESCIPIYVDRMKGKPVNLFKRPGKGDLIEGFFNEKSNAFDITIDYYNHYYD